MGACRGFTLAQVAAALGGRVEGDSARIVRGVAPLEDAGPEDIAFVADPRYVAKARASQAGALLVAEDLDGLSGTLVRCRSPRQALADLLLLFHPPLTAAPGVAATAIVSADARIDPTASVGALAVIESGAVVGPRARVYPLVYVGAEAQIGEGTVLHPHVVVGARVVLGRRVIVHPGAVLGADGFGFVFDGAEHRKIPQVGRLVVEDDVEVGANTTIDRATLGETVVRRGAKIDNLVMVAHNVEVGEHAIIAGQSGIAGSSRLERGVVLGGQVGVGDHVTIGAGAMLGARTGVVGNVAPGEKLLGDYGLPIREFQRIALAQRRLPELLRRVRAMERRLARLEGGADVGTDEDDDER
jgi:UDP-3-O-[3-hydroxymyristoyl] glucosamine N-acyltransferase